MPMRTFLSLDLDEVIRDRLLAAAAAVGSGGAKMKWVDDQQLHVTLKFLGDVPDERINEVCSIASEVAEGVESFEFHVQGMTCVPPGGSQLRMIWAGVDDPTGRMGVLHERLDEALSGLGLKEEDRAFKPHITLARVRFVKDASVLRAAAQRYLHEAFGTQHAEELVAYSSKLTSEGPIYTPLAKAKLA